MHVHMPLSLCITFHNSYMTLSTGPVTCDCCHRLISGRLQSMFPSLSCSLTHTCLVSFLD